MSLVIPQLSAALLAVIFLNEFVKTEKEKLWPLFKKCLYVAGGTVAVLGLFYFFSDFSNTATGELRKSINEAMKGQGNDFTRSYFNALKADRQAFYLGDMGRTIGFILVLMAAMFMYAKNWIKPGIVYTAIILFCVIDLLGVSMRYLKDGDDVNPPAWVDAANVGSDYIDS
ncbi:MAG: hypothetical protein IPO01_11310 [Chitinophagaceae bacterium]|nr:hypothetical protein [Chitinophagaceae bacterium]